MTRAAWIVALVMWGCTAQANDDGNEKGKTKAYAVNAATSPEVLQTNVAGKFAITISPKPPWVLKSETPLKIELTASANVTLDKTVLTAKDLVDPKATAKTVQTGVVAKTAGKHEIGAALSFFLCKADICQRFKDELKTAFTARK